MRKSLFLFIALLFVNYVNANDDFKVLSQTSNQIVVERTYTAVETFVRQESEDNRKESKFVNNKTKNANGNFGMAARVGYNLGGGSIDFGGSIYCNFSSSTNKSKLGIVAGFDYCSDAKPKTEAEEEIKKYWDARAGVILFKYVGLGGVYGQVTKNSNTTKEDWGAFVSLYLPLCDWIGLNIDGKWTKETKFTVGGGLIVQIPTKK